MSSPTKAYVWYGNAGAYSANALGPKMAARGWQVTSGTIGTNALPTAQQLKDEGYGVLGMDARFWGLGGSELAVAYAAYELGLNVFTVGNDTTHNVNNPIWTGSTSNSADAGTLSPITPKGTHPVAQGWTSIADADARVYQTGLRATVTVVGEFTNNLNGGAKLPAIFVEENPNGNGARYIHCQPQTDTLPAGFWAASLGWIEVPGGMGRVWNGSSWVYRSVSAHDGTKWVKRPIKKYLNGVWVNI